MKKKSLMTLTQNPKEPGDSNPAVLFVDDDADALVLYGYLFQSDPIRVLKARSGLHALEVLRAESPVVIVSDYWMPGMTGAALLDEVRRLYPSMGRVLLTGSPDSEIVIEAKRHKVLTKGMDRAIIRQAILREVHHHDR